MPNTFSMMGKDLTMIHAMPKPSTGSTATNTRESLALCRKAMMRANTRVQGARKAMRTTIMKACWTLVTSVVMRVTRPAVENLSILEKEKSWM